MVEVKDSTRVYATFILRGKELDPHAVTEHIEWIIDQIEPVG